MAPGGLAIAWAGVASRSSRPPGVWLKGAAGLTAAFWAGWMSPTDTTNCTPPGPRVTLGGFATESAPRRRGSVDVEVVWVVDGRTGGAGVRRPPVQCREVEAFGHDGRLVAGEVVEIEGRWQSGWRGRSALAIDNVRVVEGDGARSWSATLARARASLDERIRRVVDPDQAPLGLGLLSGRRRELPGSVREAFARTGTAHLLAISGFHVGVVAGLLALGLAALGANPTVRSWASCCLVWVYVATIGSPPSAVRAAGLLTVVSAGRWMGRPTERLSALSVVFLACLLADPRALTSIGFQLSFAASWGIVRARDWPDRAWDALNAWGSKRLAVGWVRVGPTTRSWVSAGLEWVVRGSAVALGATLPTIPLVAWHFGAVSLISIPATLMAMPLTAASIVAVLAAVAADSVSLRLGAFLGQGATEILSGLATVVAVLSGIPFASVSAGPRFAVVATVFAGVLTWILRRGTTPRATMAAVLASWVAATSLIAGAARWRGRGTVEIAFLDVGQGDAIAIRSPANRWILVDAGGRGAVVGLPTGQNPSGRLATWDAGSRRVTPFLDARGVEELEVFALTHADADHVGGAAAVLSAKRVGSVVGPARAAGGGPFVEALDVAARRGVPWRRGSSGDRWTLDGVTIDVLSPDQGRLAGSPNEDSLVLLVRFGAFEALLTGDASTEIEKALLDRLPTELEVLKVGHHGSRTSTAEELLSATRPEVAVISSGARNRYGHPAPEVVARLERHGARILRTDRHGTVRITADESGGFSVQLDRP